MTNTKDFAKREIIIVMNVVEQRSGNTIDGVRVCLLILVDPKPARRAPFTYPLSSTFTWRPRRPKCTLTKERHLFI